MNWKDCVRLKLSLAEDKLATIEANPRFQWPSDGIAGFDCEKGVTIHDIWGVISWIWTYPGDLILSYDLPRNFFDIEGAVAIGAVGSTILVWLLLLGWARRPADFLLFLFAAGALVFLA